MENAGSKFRLDINGLRAIAVIFVVLYHFHGVGFGGGFVGVDIFFVISGYLMTKIIITRIDKGFFNYFDFIIDRSKRIIPALAAMCTILFCIGWKILPPFEFSTLGKHIASSMLFISNIIYFTESGYFNLNSESNWLLHTWSLSVEWQFYLVYPAILWFICKLIKPKRVKIFLLLLFLVSFILSAIYSKTEPDLSYFMLHTRAWEILAGGIVFFHRPRFEHPLLFSYAGLILILLSLFIIDSTLPWPGFMAAIPVMGTVLIIASSSVGNILLENKVSQFIGKISYSVYLWHWPVIVMMRYMDIGFTPSSIISGSALSFIFGTISFYAIERTTHKINFGRLVTLGFYAFTTLAFSTMSYSAFTHDGYPFRVSQSIVSAEREAKTRNVFHDKCLLISGDSIKGCIVGGDVNKKPSVILIGDSHADATLGALIKAIPKDKGGVLFLGYRNCLPIPNVEVFSQTPGFACGKYNSKIFSMLSNEYHGIPVIVVTRFSAYLYGTYEIDPSPKSRPLAWFGHRPNYFNEEYKNDISKRYSSGICSISKDREVYLIKPYPGVNFDVPQKVTQRMMMHDSRPIKVDKKKYLARNNVAISIIENTSRLCGANLIDPTTVFCNSKDCLVAEKGKSFYYDGTHINEIGNKKMTPLLESVFK